MSDFVWLMKVAGLAWVGCSICVGRTVDNAPRPKGVEGGVNGLEPMAGFQVVMARQAAEKGDPRAQFTLGPDAPEELEDLEEGAVKRKVEAEGAEEADDVVAPGRPGGGLVWQGGGPGTAGSPVQPRVDAAPGHGHPQG